MMSYDRLWCVMREQGITQYALIKRHHVSPAQITRLKRNESVSTHTIEVFCRTLHCQVADIMQYVPDEEETDFKATALVTCGCFFRWQRNK